MGVNMEVPYRNVPSASSPGMSDGIDVEMCISVSVSVSLL